MPGKAHKPATAGNIDLDLLEQLELYNESLEHDGFSKHQREELLRKYKEYDTELKGKGYEELAKHYKALDREVQTDVERRDFYGDLRPNSPEIHRYDKANLRSVEDLDTSEELKGEIIGLLKQRDSQNELYQGLEAHYHKELEGLKTYKELAENYKALYGTLNNNAFRNEGDFDRTNLKSFEHLDTYEELKRATVYLFKERDHFLELSARYESELEAADTY